MSKQDLNNFEYEQEQKPKVIVKKKGGFWGKFFTFILGFVIGAVGTVGGVAGVGYYLAKNKTVGEVLEMAKVPYDTYSEYISDTYSEKIVWDAVGSLVKTAKDLDKDVTLGDLAEISPYVTKKAMNAAEGAYNSYGIDLNMDGNLMDIPLVNLNQHLTDCIKRTPLGDMISKFNSNDLNPILVALLYGEKDEDYYVDDKGEYHMYDGKKSLTIADFSGSVLNERLNALPVDLLIKIDKTDTTLCTIAYGTANRYIIDPTTQEVDMQPMYFLYENGKFLNDNGEELQYSATPVKDTTDAYILTVAEKKNDKDEVIVKSQTYYVEKAKDGKYYAYDQTANGGKGENVLFPKTTVGTLQHDATSLINKVLLKDALHVTYQSHPMLIALSYGEETVDYDYKYDQNGNKVGIEEINTPRTIGEIKANSQAIFENMYLTDVIQPKRDNKMVMYLLYGKEGVHYSYNETTGKYDPMQKRVAVDGKNVYNEYGELITGATANGVLSYTQGGKVYTLTAIENTDITVKRNIGTVETPQYEKVSRQAYYVSDENGAVNYTRTQFKELSQASAPLLHNMTGRLTLSDVIDVEEDDTLLVNLKDVVIEDLAQAVKELTVLQVFGGENGSIQYLTFAETDIKDGVYTTRHSVSYAVFEDQTGKYYLYDTQKVYVGSYVDWDGKPVSGDNRILTKIWWYLLHDYNQPNNPTAVIDYPLLEFEKLADNMTHNMKIVTLNQLNADEIVETGDAVRTKKLVKEILMGDEEVYTYSELAPGIPLLDDKGDPILNKDATLYKYYVAVVLNSQTVEMGEMTVPEMMHYLEVAVDEYNALLEKTNATP